MVEFHEKGDFSEKSGFLSPGAESSVKPCHILCILRVRIPENHVIFMNFQLFT